MNSAQPEFHPKPHCPQGTCSLTLRVYLPSGIGTIHRTHGRSAHPARRKFHFALTSTQSSPSGQRPLVFGLLSLFAHQVHGNRNVFTSEWRHKCNLSGFGVTRPVGKVSVQRAVAIGYRINKQVSANERTFPRTTPATKHFFAIATRARFIDTNLK